MSIKNEVREFSHKVASVKGAKRKLLRKEDKEVLYINNKFTELLDEFHLIVFMTDWDKANLTLTQLNPFNDFNLAWVNWCKNYKGIVKPNKKAFHEYACDNLKTNKDDRPIFIVGDKLTNLRWTL